MILPAGVNAVKDRHGKTRYRFRRVRMPSRYLPGEPGSDVFMAAYDECLSAIERPKPPRPPRRKPKVLSGQPYVYFIGERRGPVKIGTSNDVMRRLCDMQVSYPRRLSVLAVTPGGADIERMYHQHFAGDRMSGEWFRRTPALMAEMKRLRDANLSNRKSGSK
ncbi:GIY-YIG nuclease family protein [Rhizorhabdus wittichii]|uniref:GIY-YIG nuclease family protein n=1 Tax=Rhizorhabdus wittichii TaxID=160791 RepID=A0A975CZ34_9SPHN|nr:GIY-YIG nuclease family protein [Rhizorhabdus wittichii]QTH19613.1 GIY-YIG nuclease family protein [Rhizorhabdus wittichii]